MKTLKSSEKINYTQPLIGNGSVTGTFDYCLRQRANGFIDDKTSYTPEASMWWAGRRYRYDTDCGNLNRKGSTLIPFGIVDENINGVKSPEPLDWEQELDTEHGVLYSKCIYEKCTIKSRAYIHYDYDMLSITKEFDKNTDYEFIYKLKGANGNKIERFEYSYSPIENGVCIAYKIDGIMEYVGELYIFSDKKLNVNVCDNEVTLGAAFKAGDSASMYVLYGDDFETPDYKEMLAKRQKAVLSDSEREFDNHCKLWSEYMNAGTVKLPDEELNNVYKTSQYHLKTLSTKWSVPMGMNNAQWHGRYFAFDEVFIVTAFLTSDHIDAARKILEFRKNTLPAAEQRVSSSHTNIRQANYACLVIENGDEDVTPGYWNDHIFQNTSVAVGMLEYYLYTNDIDFLRDVAYPVIESCTKFYVNHMIYKDGEKLYIGKCTDLERLGASISNAYMTTCSVVVMLEIFAKITEILGCNEEYGIHCKELSKQLIKYLPNDGEKYIPYPGCEVKSIGVLSGAFPYYVKDLDFDMQMKAINDFVSEELVFGNMYKVGGNISSWYASWKANAYTRLKDKRTYQALKQACQSTGHFGEMYEINEPGCVFRPWFTTAAGSYIGATNDMLVQCVDDIIYLAPALADYVTDFEFSLAVRGNIKVSAKVKNNELLKFDIKCKQNGNEYLFKVVVPDHINVPENSVLHKLESENIYVIKRERG